MADEKPKYGSKQSITITMTDLAQGASRQSLIVSNATDLWEDALVEVNVYLQGPSLGPVDVYVYASADGGTTLPDGVTGTDAAFTPYTFPGLLYLGSTGWGGGALRLVMPSKSVAALFGGSMPQYWGIVVVNNTTQLFAGTGNSIEAFFQGQMHQIV